MRGPLDRRLLPAAVAAFLAALAPLGASGCSSTPTADLTITTGGETDAFARAPTPTSLLVEGLGLDGTVTQLAQTKLPDADAISLGDKGRTDVGAIRLTASDASGKILLKGQSLYLQFGALQDSPLEVFMQRTGELARLPRDPETLDAPLLGLTVQRYLVAASGTNVYLYDLLRLTTLAGIAPLPRTAKSFVTFGTAAIVIDDTAASTVDLSTQMTSDLAAPVGGSFAEIAGGAAVYVDDGSAFVVGGTRTGSPSSRVLAITAAGIVAFATLATPRQGACATWVPGRGLVIVGGTTDPKAPGAELLVSGSVQGTPLAYPADAVKGCGATALDASHVLVAGGAGSAVDVKGAAPARVLDLACSEKCAAAPWPGPMPLVRAEAFTLGVDAALITGDDATGATRVFRATSKGATEIMVKAPRRNARMIALPTAGTVGIVGGAAPIEQYLE